MACEVYVSAPPASSATVTAGQRVQVKLPGQRTREVTLDTGASADTPVRNQGPGPSLPDRRRPSPASRGTITGKLAGCNLGCSSPQSGSVRRGPSGALIQLEPIGMPIPRAANAVEFHHPSPLPSVANTVAKPPDNGRRMQTEVEYRPSTPAVMDGPGRCAHSYGSALGTAGAAPYRREKWLRYRL